MRSRALLAGAAVLALARAAAARPTVDVGPALAGDVAVGAGWSEIVVRVENVDATPARGTVEVVGTPSAYDERPFSARARWSAGAGTTVVLSVPVAGSSLQIAVRDDRGSALLETALTLPPLGTPVLVDLHPTPRLVGAMRGTNVALGWDPTGAAPRRPAPITVAQPRWNGATGEAMLPERPIGWAGATAVAIGSDQLTALEGRRLSALLDWVLGGGTLAVSVTRPEDLRHPTMLALVGEVAPAGMPPLHLMIGPIEGEEDEEPPDPGQPSAPHAPPVPLPSAEVLQRLHGFSRGHLHATRLGSSASYGLGEVHLVPFDTGSATDLGDAWVRGRLADLVGHAWDRRAAIAVTPGREPPGDGALAEIGRELDPNESARWAVGLAALLLVAYAVLAGPVSFSQATRAGRPLRALSRLPAFSAVAFLAIVLLGMAGRGVRGRSRRVSLIEAGAGMSRASAVRWRGFYLPDARDLVVPASGPEAVLRPVGEDAAGKPRLEVDRDGARLVDLPVMPWQTAMVREDGIASIGAGLSIVDDPTRGVVLANRLGRDLLGVLLVVPGAPARFFPRLRDGASVAAREGEEVPRFSPPGALVGHGLRQLDLGAAIAPMDAAAAGLPGAWEAVAAAGSGMVDWFPSDVPVALAQIEGGEGRLDDAGPPVEHDRTLLRVVGWGGLP